MSEKKPRIHVKNLGDAMKQLRAALDANAELAGEVAKLTEIKDQEWVKRRAAETDAKNARAEHVDLKTKLYDAEIENARLRGFVERVREDDAVRDPLVEVEDAQGKRQVTKRFPSNTVINYTMQHRQFGEPYTGYNEAREKPKHWTSY